MPHAAATLPSRKVTIRSMRAAKSGLWVAISAATPPVVRTVPATPRTQCRRSDIEVPGRLVCQHNPASWPMPGRSRHAAVRLRKACPEVLGARGASPKPTATVREFGRAHGDPGDHLRQNHVLQCGKFCRTNDETDRRNRSVAPDRSALAIGERPGVATIDEHYPPSGRSSSPAKMQQRRFAGPRRGGSATISPALAKGRPRAGPAAFAASVGNSPYPAQFQRRVTHAQRLDRVGTGRAPASIRCRQQRQHERHHHNLPSPRSSPDGGR